jgi:hypothetical protein
VEELGELESTEMELVFAWKYITFIELSENI